MTQADIDDCKDQLDVIKQQLGQHPQAASGKQGAGGPTAFNPLVIIQAFQLLLPVIEQILTNLKPAGGTGPGPAPAKASKP